MGNVDASARYRRLITFSVLGIIILGLCACNNLLPDRGGPSKMPEYDYYEQDDRDCPPLVDSQPNKPPKDTYCFVVTTEKTTDMRLLARIVKDMVDKQRITVNGRIDIVWVQFRDLGDTGHFRIFATGFHFDDKDDADLVLSDEEQRRATVVDDVYVLEGALNFY
jgi:hypothetical protein